MTHFRRVIAELRDTIIDLLETRESIMNTRRRLQDAAWVLDAQVDILRGKIDGLVSPHRRIDNIQRPAGSAAIQYREMDSPPHESMMGRIVRFSRLSARTHTDIGQHSMLRMRRR